MNLKLTVWLKDGRELSGTYNYLIALARQEFAKTLPEYDHSIIENAK